MSLCLQLRWEASQSLHLLNNSVFLAIWTKMRCGCHLLLWSFFSDPYLVTSYLTFKGVCSMESAAISMSCKWAVIFIAKPLGNILMLKQIEQEQQKTISLTGASLVRFYLQARMHKLEKKKERSLMYFILIIRVNNPARIMVHKSLKVGLFYYSIGTNTQVVFYFTFFLAYRKKKTPPQKKNRNKASVLPALALSRVCFVIRSVISLYLQRNSWNVHSNKTGKGKRKSCKPVIPYLKGWYTHIRGGKATSPQTRRKHIISRHISCKSLSNLG